MCGKSSKASTGSSTSSKKTKSKSSLSFTRLAKDCRKIERAMKTDAIEKARRAAGARARRDILPRRIRSETDLSDKRPAKSALNVRDDTDSPAVERLNSIVAASLEVKRSFFERHSAEVARAAYTVAEGFRAGGKLLVFGNGGLAAAAPPGAARVRNPVFV